MISLCEADQHRIKIDPLWRDQGGRPAGSMAFQSMESVAIRISSLTAVWALI